MSAVDICNRALITIGEAPNVTTIEPPDGSYHAQVCAELYLPAVELVTEARRWTFNEKRVALAKVRVAISSIDTGADNITTATAHGMATDSRATLARAVAGAGTAPGGLAFDTVYYVINAGTTTVRLTDEEAGSAIDITSAGGGSMVLEKESDRAGAAYMYALPSDCLTEQRLLSANMPDDWPDTSLYCGPSLVVGVGGVYGFQDTVALYSRPRREPVKRALNAAGEEVLYCNIADAELLYSAYIDDVTQWPPAFKQAVVLQLAAWLAGSIKRDDKLKQSLEAQSRQWISESSRADALRVITPMAPRYPWNR